jgi:hypothetical protein
MNRHSDSALTAAMPHRHLSIPAVSDEEGTPLTRARRAALHSRRFDGLADRASLGLPLIAIAVTVVFAGTSLTAAGQP